MTVSRSKQVIFRVPVIVMCRICWLWHATGQIHKYTISQYPTFSLLLFQIVVFYLYIWTPVLCSTSVCTGQMKRRKAAPPARGVLATRTSFFRLSASFHLCKHPKTEVVPEFTPQNRAWDRTAWRHGRVLAVVRDRSTETLAHTSKP